MELKLEVIVLPVTDVDRSRDFYQRLDFRLDADLVVDQDYRVVQLTPPGSAASIIFGSSLSTSAGSVRGLLVAVPDIVAARDEIIARGVEVSEIFHEADPFVRAGAEHRIAGTHPERASYGSFASFSDPDGNEWLLQEITDRLPGRVEEPRTTEDELVDTTTKDLLVELLQGAASAHGVFEAEELAGVYDEGWPEWYAAHMTRALHDGGHRLVAKRS